MRESRAGFAEVFGGAAVFRFAAVVDAVGMMSGFGSSEPFVPVMWGAAVALMGEVTLHAVQSTEAWLPLHPFSMHLCKPLSHSPPGPAFDLQLLKLNP